jgi:hypothetical protein
MPSDLLFLKWPSDSSTKSKDYLCVWRPIRTNIEPQVRFHAASEQVYNYKFSPELHPPNLTLEKHLGM